MEIHNMNEWDLPIEVIMQRMTEGKEELAKSTGDLNLFRDRRFRTGQFGVQTDGLYEQYGIPDLLLSNIPFPLLDMTDAPAMFVDVISTYMFVRRDEVPFKAGMKILCEGSEFLLQEYIDEGGNFVVGTLELVPTQDEVPYCASCEANQCVGE
tara:strand:+ start:37 stop:495 length:459 start_codon:yes stop_codon:yes gene_type:complete